MKKKFYYLFVFFSLFLIITGTVILEKEYDALQTILRKNSMSFVSGNIKNKTNFIDDELNIKINDVVELKKEVYTYQWVEEKKHLKKYGKFIYHYEKKWVNRIINSNNFKDKSKNNFTNKNIYSSKELKSNYLIITDNSKDYILDRSYYGKKIKFEKFLPNTNKIEGKIINKEFTGEYETTDTFADLDSYISSKNKIFAKSEIENFKVIDNHILFNGKDFYNPEIGDTKIIYKVFAPSSISFIGTVSSNKLSDYKGFFLVDFGNKDEESLLFKEKLEFIFCLCLFINFSIFLINKIFLILRKDEMRSSVIRHITYFNEYIIFSKNSRLDVMLIFMILMGFILDLYYLIIIAVVVLIHLRNVDYYSI